MANEEYCKLQIDQRTGRTGEELTRIWLDERISGVDLSWVRVECFEGRLGLWGQSRLIPQPSHIAFLVLKLAVDRGKRHVKDIEDLLFLTFPSFITGHNLSDLSTQQTAAFARLAMTRRSSSLDRVKLKALEEQTMSCLLHMLACHYVFKQPFSSILKWSTAWFDDHGRGVSVLWRRENNTVFYFEPCA